MKNSVFFIYLLILAGSTYLIRVIPFIAIKEKINNSFVRSFLYYIPYAVLTAMTIPAVFYATNWWVGAAAGLIAAVIFALKGKGLTTVAVASCVAVFIVELIFPPERFHQYHIRNDGIFIFNLLSPVYVTVTVIACLACIHSPVCFLRNIVYKLPVFLQTSYTSV